MKVASFASYIVIACCGTVPPPFDLLDEVRALDWQSEKEKILERIADQLPTLIRNSGTFTRLTKSWNPEHVSKHFPTEPRITHKATTKGTSGNFLFHYHKPFDTP
jgi:hypothetical protein